ncbi:MAG: NADAR family protein [Planctomycetes bacterium]|nr:NADAR family protein [Planctomycetota bacterium]
MAIYFYGRTGQWGEFSNFAHFPFELDGKVWPTSEHYFQAQKFAGTEHEEAIRAARKPNDAARMGRERSRPLRPDWEQVKDDVMRKAVWAKFTTHPELKALLLSTGEQELVENAPGDYYWGCGKDGSGRNMLGRILMETRQKLRA